MKHAIVGSYEFVVINAAEMAILEATCLYDTDREVANSLGYSCATVRKHLRCLFVKFGVRSKHRLVAICVSRKLMVLPY